MFYCFWKRHYIESTAFMTDVFIKTCVKKKNFNKYLPWSQLFYQPIAYTISHFKVYLVRNSFGLVGWIKRCPQWCPLVVQWGCTWTGVQLGGRGGGVMEFLWSVTYLIFVIWWPIKFHILHYLSKFVLYTLIWYDYWICINWTELTELIPNHVN